MAAEYITLNGASFLLGGSITTMSQSDFVAYGIKQGHYRYNPAKQKTLLVDVWKLANPKKK